MGAAQVIVGAGLKCSINGVSVGESTSFEFISETPKREIRGLDCPDPYEIAHTTTKVRGTIGLYRLSRRGGLEGYGIVSNFHNMHREKYVTITLVDRRTDQTVFQCIDAVITSQSWRASARGIMTGSFTFEGISWVNEIESEGAMDT
jgi:hypothetical protein